MMRECRFDIPIPETISEAQANRQIKHHVNVSPSFTARLNNGRPKLDVFASTLIEAKADPQPLSFPSAGNREHDIGIGGGGR